MKATAKDLRFHSKELLDTVKRGEEVLITYRGKPYAKLVPITGELDVVPEGDHQLFGIWANHPDTESVDEYVDRVRESRV